MASNNSAREAALHALIELRTRGSWPDRMLKAELSGMSTEDAGLATAIANGVLQQRALLDFYLSSFSSIKLNRVMPQVLDSLRVGAYQLVFMDKVPAYAAINESVALAKKHGGARAGGYVNALLRTIDRERERLPEPDKSDNIRYLSIKYSHPVPLVERFIGILGETGCEKLLAANNAHVSHTARVNTLKTSLDELVSLLGQGVAMHHEYLPDALVLHSMGGKSIAGALENGLMHIIDTASQLCVLALNPKPGSRLLDMCAAPGGKTLMAAQLIGGEGSILASDVHPGKAERLAQSAKVYGADGVISATTADAASFNPALADTADYIICDVPCSGYGIIRKKPDIRYKSLESTASLPALQAQILQNAARYLRPGGALVYSTCTVLPEENECVVTALLENEPSLELCGFELPHLGRIDSGMLTLWPHIHNTDGFFMAKIRKTG